MQPAILLSVLLLASDPATQPAQETKSPPRTRLETPDRQWRLEIIPTKYSPRVKGTCVARLERRRGDDARPDEPRSRHDPDRKEPRPRGWTRCLVNDRSPERAMLTADGAYVVTIDEWPGDSGRHPLVIYGPEGELIRHFRLEDLIDARAAAEARERGDPVRWGRSAKFAFSRDNRHLIVRAPAYETLLVELATGNLLRRGDAALAREPQMKAAWEEALAAGDEFFPSVEPVPVADPGEKTDFLGWLNELFRGSDEGNSGPLLDAAVAQMSHAGETAELSQAISQAAKAWDPQASAAVAEWLDRNAPALDLFRQAAGKAGYRFDLYSEDGSMLHALLPNLPSIRILTRGLLADASRALADGRVDAAADDYADTLRMGRQLLERPTLIERLTGLAATGGAYESLLRLPLRADPSVDFAALRERFSSPDLEIPSLAGAVECERLFFHDTLQRLFTYDAASGTPVPDAQQVKNLVRDVGGGNEAEILEALKSTDFDQMLTKADEYYDELSEMMRSDFPTARPRLERWDQQLEHESNPLIKAMLPSLSRARTLHTAGQVRRRAALLNLALHEHQQRTGAFPASLSALNVPGLDPSATIDPFTEQPFRYERSGESFRLWTPGVDGLEHGGKTVPLSQEGGDSVLFPPP